LSDPDGLEIEATVREDLSQPSEPMTAPPGKDLPGALSPDDGIAGWGNISLSSEPDHGPDDGEINLAGGAGHQPPPPITEGDLPDSAVSVPTPTSTPEQTTVSAFHPIPPSQKKGRKSLVILLVLSVLGAGGYFGYPRVMKIINAQGEKPEGTLTPDKIQVHSLTRQDGKVIYTVKGEVRNNSFTSVGMIQIEAQFRNDAGDIIAKSSSYCGNVFEDPDITTGDLAKIRTDLQNELGQSLSNSNIRPGQAVPFLTVLENPPAGISKVTVTISGFKKTT